MSTHMIICNPGLAGQLPVSIGMKGPINTSAVVVSPASQQVQVKAVTFGNRSSDCAVGLPNNPDILREIAATLLMVASDIDSKADRICRPIEHLTHNLVDKIDQLEKQQTAQGE